MNLRNVALLVIFVELSLQTETGNLSSNNDDKTQFEEQNKSNQSNNGFNFFSLLIIISNYKYLFF
jgi:hypothetical protein